MLARSIASKLASCGRRYSSSGSSSEGTSSRLGAELLAIGGALAFGAYLDSTGYMQRRRQLPADEEWEEQSVLVAGAADLQEHYAKGLNHNFICGCEEQVMEMYGGPKGKFENTEIRDIAKNLPAIIEMLERQVGLRGKRLLDVGAGTGLFLAAVTENGGEYHAIEISETFVKHLKERIESTGTHSQASASLCSDKSTLCPAGSADVAIIVDVYHHFEYPITFMRSLHKTLAPGGKVVLLDFHRDDDKITSHPKGWVYKHVRAGQEVFRAEIEKAGFTYMSEPVVPGLVENYVMVFKRKGDE